MNYKTVKILQGIALFLQLATVLITILMTVGQRAAKALINNDPKVLELRTIPVDTLIQIVPILILYGITLLVVAKSQCNSTKVKTIACIIIAIVLRILIPFAGMLFVSSYAATHGVYAHTSHISLTTAIELVISPIQLTAFALFCLSLGGYYGIEKREETN